MAETLKHAFAKLDGLALQMHLRNKHGWTEDMIKRRGKDDYAVNWHISAHATEPDD